MSYHQQERLESAEFWAEDQLRSVFLLNFTSLVELNSALQTTANPHG